MLANKPDKIVKKKNRDCKVSFICCLPFIINEVFKDITIKRAENIGIWKITNKPTIPQPSPRTNSVIGIIVKNKMTNKGTAIKINIIENLLRLFLNCPRSFFL